ncbi:hypothetical protein K437DRAFT_25806 [Tilletiaria anomala UBC 951]|uniref:Uncharacterized protein n=1 Tax=Tilletiaria anomala (strain ATCC 24038 / CBS 436.72 / UBC 951) TaxID=1037660 RepID=A0A066WNS7_TILAU|nr:uncharacterized protein K437DRAFT_25806 [Tilletiaria anomala UBC 951]KDN52265.1 hypothetical protein K437DRAFT_25806 [Tilletiaria anomala UBC 951]
MTGLIMRASSDVLNFLCTLALISHSNAPPACRFFADCHTSTPSYLTEINSKRLSARSAAPACSSGHRDIPEAAHRYTVNIPTWSRVGQPGQSASCFKERCLQVHANAVPSQTSS